MFSNKKIRKLGHNLHPTPPLCQKQSFCYLLFEFMKQPDQTKFKV